MQIPGIQIEPNKITTLPFPESFRSCCFCVKKTIIFGSISYLREYGN